jgi:hypothetical protein
VILAGRTDEEGKDFWAVKLRSVDGGSDEAVPSVVDGAPVADPDGDGHYEDINGDNSTDLLDVRVLFRRRNTDAVTSNGQLFDFSRDGTFDLLDIRTLFDQLR